MGVVHTLCQQIPIPGKRIIFYRKKGRIDSRVSKLDDFDDHIPVKVNFGLVPSEFYKPLQNMAESLSTCILCVCMRVHVCNYSKSVCVHRDCHVYV